MMKKTIISAVLFILLFSASYAQRSDSTYKSKEFRTLLGENRPHGFYGAFSIGYSEIDKKQAIQFGGRFVWITGHSLGVGFGGTGFINEYHYEPALGKNAFLTGGYGGLFIEPIVMPNYPVHISFPVLLGAGGISYVTKESNFTNNMIEDSEAFLLIEPGAEIELNLTRFFRLAIGASYRFPTSFEVGLPGTAVANARSIEGMTYNLTFKFGRF